MINITTEEFNKFVGFIHTNYGIDLTKKRELLVGRLQNVLLQKDVKSFSEYYDYVISDQTGEAVSMLLNKLTTNHTFFLREVDHFNFFRDHVLPEFEAKLKNKDLRVWSAGCSSGEEPYTLAMLIADYFGAKKGLWDSRILATDISKNVLEKANDGVYTCEQVAAVPERWRKMYFSKVDDDSFQVKEVIKQEVIFRAFNLNNPQYPFKKTFHVIFCRNVMIYFDNQTKKSLLEKFYEFTEPGGYLFIGHAETLNRNETPFKYVMPAVYRKE